MYLSYFGIRVTDIEKSYEFYTDLFGLEEVTRGDKTALGGGIYVLLKDSKSGQKLELNWYPKESKYADYYIPGEGLDHIAFNVDNMDETLRMLKEKKSERIEIDQLAQPPAANYRLAYVKDPDGNWIELYQRINEPVANNNSGRLLIHRTKIPNRLEF